MVQDNQIVSKDELKEYLNACPSDTSLDNLLDTIINAVSDVMEDQCNTRLKAAQVTELLSGLDSNILILSNMPVNSITSFQYWDGDVYVDYYDSLTELQRDLVPDASLVYSRSHCFAEGVKNYRITYSCGYANVPYALKLVAMELSAIIFRDTPHSEYSLAVTAVNISGYKQFITKELERHGKILAKYTLKSV